MLSISIGNVPEAKKLLAKCINEGKIFDARIVQAAAEHLRKLIGEEGKLNWKLERIAKQFEVLDRDFVFLINCSTAMPSMENHLSKICKGLTQILNNDDIVSQNDRISLITYATEQRKVFSLVEKNKNFTQLLNQF